MCRLVSSGLGSWELPAGADDDGCGEMSGRSLFYTDLGAYFLSNYNTEEKGLQVRAIVHGTEFCSRRASFFWWVSYLVSSSLGQPWLRK